MDKAGSTSTEITLRDPDTGRVVTVRGAGALKGQLLLQKGIDLTRPIASQAVKGAGARKAAVRKH